MPSASTSPAGQRGNGSRQALRLIARCVAANAATYADALGTPIQSSRRTRPLFEEQPRAESIDRMRSCGPQTTPGKLFENPASVVPECSQTGYALSRSTSSSPRAVRLTQTDWPCRSRRIKPAAASWPH